MSVRNGKESGHENERKINVVERMRFVNVANWDNQEGYADHEEYRQRKQMRGRLSFKINRWMRIIWPTSNGGE